jgi:AhpD family alkylhydroperoxidase
MTATTAALPPTNADAAAGGLFGAHHARMGRMKAESPEIARAFGGMFAGLMKDNAAAGGLSALHKELVALAIGIAQHCTPCILSHVEKCMRLGATRQQVLDAAAVAVVMQGGPAYVHVPVVLEALDAMESNNGAPNRGAGA